MKKYKELVELWLTQEPYKKLNHEEKSVIRKLLLVKAHIFANYVGEQWSKNKKINMTMLDSRGKYNGTKRLIIKLNAEKKYNSD